MFVVIMYSYYMLYTLLEFDVSISIIILEPVFVFGVSAIVDTDRKKNGSIIG